MPSGIGIGGAYVPYNSVARDSLSDIVVVDDDGGCGHRGVAPQEEQGNEDQAFHDRVPSPWRVAKYRDRDFKTRPIFYQFSKAIQSVDWTAAVAPSEPLTLPSPHKCERANKQGFLFRVV